MPACHMVKFQLSLSGQFIPGIHVKHLLRSLMQVEPGSFAADLGLSPGDEILRCRDIDFRNPEGPTGPPFITHAQVRGRVF